VGVLRGVGVWPGKAEEGWERAGHHRPSFSLAPAMAGCCRQEIRGGFWGEQVRRVRARLGARLAGRRPPAWPPGLQPSSSAPDRTEEAGA